MNASRDRSDNIINIMMHGYEFYIGQEVVVRDWDDMLAEFNEYPGGIDVMGLGFLDGMAYLCGRKLHIQRITPSRVYFTEGFDRFECNLYMVRPSDRPELLDLPEPEEQFFAELAGVIGG